MLFSQTVSLIFFLAPSAFAAKYHKVTYGDIKLAPSVDVGVDCETHVYTGVQLRKLAFNSLRFGNIVNYCRENLLCMKKIDYRNKYMGYVENPHFPFQAYYIRIRSSGGPLKGRIAKNNIVVVSEDGFVLGVLTKIDTKWYNCPNRPSVGLLRPEQEVDVRSANQKAINMKNAKPSDAAQTADMNKNYPAESDKASSAQRGATSPRGAASPRGPSSPRAAENMPKDAAPVADPSTSGSN